MTQQVKGVPEGFHTLTPHLVVKDGKAAIEFYKKAFGAEEIMRYESPDGKIIAHAELKIGDSFIFLGDECPGMSRSPQSLGGSSVTLSLYVEDADATFNRAVAAGARVEMPLEDAFWGDRYGQVVDPFGHQWAIATHVRDVDPEEMKKAMEAAFAQMGGEHGASASGE